MLALRRAREAPSAAPAAPAGPDALAARAVPEAVTREAPAELKLMVACVCESARAATNIGWITHDVREVADSTATIVSSVEALANTISELSASSTATSAKPRRCASRCDRGLYGCRETRGRDRQIFRRTGGSRVASVTRLNSPSAGVDLARTVVEPDRTPVPVTPCYASRGLRQLPGHNNAHRARARIAAPQLHETDQRLVGTSSR